MNSIVNLLRKFSDSSKKSSSLVLLHGMYFIGIGLTAVFSKIVAKKFINHSHEKSTWVENIKNSDPEMMF